MVLLLIGQAFTYYPTESGAILFFMVFCGIVLYAVFQVRKAPWYNKWSLARRIRQLRKVYRTTPGTMALYAISFVFICAVPMAQGMGFTTIAVSCLTAGGVLLCIATIADWYVRLKYILKSKVAQRVIVAIVGFVGTTTLLTSNVIANHIVFDVSQADPARMPEFVRIAAAVIQIFSVALVVSSILALMMMIQSMAVMLAVWTTTIFDNLSSATSPLLRSKNANIPYRLITGRRPPQRRSWASQMGSTIHFVMRPIGTGTCATIVAAACIALTSVGAIIPKLYVQEALVMIQYHSRHKCENVDSRAYIAFQDDGYVSVAMKDGETYTFENKKCHS